MSADLFTNDEVACMVESKKRLEEQGVPVSRRELAVVCLSSDLNVNQATDKYKRWLESMKCFGINSFDEIWGGVKGDGSDEEELRQMTHHFATCAGIVEFEIC